MGLKGILKKIFSIFKSRAGFDKFADRYKGLAVETVTKLALAHDGKSLHEWQDEAWQKMKEQVQADGQEVRGTWLTILIASSYEAVLAEAEKGEKK